MPFKIYLAGPDVFHQDSQQRFDALRSHCASFGLTAVSHCEDDLGFTPSELQSMKPSAVAKLICDSNVRKVRGCDGVLANLSPFRGGIEPDSGTVFEVGMAIALGKPVAVYLPDADKTLFERIEKLFGVRPRPGSDDQFEDAQYGMLVEHFGHALNLMISCTASIHSSPLVEEGNCVTAAIRGFPSYDQ